MRTHYEVVNLIESSDWATESERSRVVSKFFSGENLAAIILQNKYNFGERRVLDIGCSYGQSLLYWGESSIGVDVSEQMAGLPKALGYEVYLTNIEDRLYPEEWKADFDGAFSDNLIEHLVSPHLFLVRINRILNDDGLLVLGHPTVPFTSLAKNIWRCYNGFDGYLAGEHINFYTPETISLTLKRAGFKVIDQWQPLPRKLNSLRKLVGPFSTHCYTVAKKIKNWQYSSKRISSFDPSIYEEELKEFHS